MKQTAIDGRSRTPTVDYSAARERAIKWLGDRYLLAKPINASESDRRRARGTGSSARTAA